MTSTPPKSFLVAEDEAGGVRLIVREVRYNSQGYPWTSSRLLARSSRAYWQRVATRLRGSTRRPESSLHSRYPPQMAPLTAFHPSRP